MSNKYFKVGTLFVLCAGLALTILTLLQESPPDRLLLEIATLEFPRAPAEKAGEDAKETFKYKQRKVLEKRAELIGELYKANPEQPELDTLLPERWTVVRNNPELDATVKTELAEVLARRTNPALLQDAAFFQAILALKEAGIKAKPEVLLAAAEPFVKKYSKDMRLPSLLLALSDGFEDLDSKIKFYEWIEKSYPGSALIEQVEVAKARVEGERRILQLLGKPFDIEFTDLVKGTKISRDSLKGKVVVVDFWATWCAPCIQEMPTMMSLYEQYKGQGVEFVGVSLDRPIEEGGLDRLKQFVIGNNIPWPQYYLGKGFESEFAEKWGVIAIPAVYLVDADGNLVSYAARGQLEKLIPEYLEKAKKPKS